MAQAQFPQSNAIKSQLNWIFLLRIILYTALFGINYFLREESNLPLPAPLTTILLLSIYSFTIFSALHLQRYNKKTSRIVFWQILADNLLATFFVYITGGSASIFSSVFFFPIISGALLLSGIRGLSQSATATLLYAFILTLEFNGFLPDYIKSHTATTTKSLSSLSQGFATQGLLFFLVGFLSFLLGSRMQKAEVALASSRKEFLKLSQLHKHIFENIGSGIISIKPDHSISDANQAALEILDKTKVELIGAPLSAIFPEIDLQIPHETKKFTYKLAQAPKIIEFSTAVLRQAGAPRTPETTGRHQIIVFKDITAFEKLEAQLHQAEKLAAIGTMSASIAHDFRNPLTATLGCAQILINDTKSGESDRNNQLELLNIIERESKRLLTTISNFLFFARPNSPQFSWFSIHQCIKDAHHSCSQNPHWPPTCQVLINKGNGVDIYADREQIFTILTHLLENAMAFCPKGSEQVTITITDQQSDTNSEGVELTVEDNGTGVAEEDLTKIFEPFYTKRADGTGLGLSIVQQYISAHNGAIWVRDSSLGGACFHIFLPFPVDTILPHPEKEQHGYDHQSENDLPLN